MIALLGVLVTSGSSHPTLPDVGVFAVSAAIVLAGAIGVVVARNPVHSALMLVMTLFGIAVLFVLQQASFLAAVQVIVYAGAIMVLFVFVIMLLNAGEEEHTQGSRVALLLGVPGIAIGGVLVAWTVLRHSNTEAVALGALPGPPKDVARLLFHDFLLPFEVTSVLILIAIMGAVVLASKPGAIVRDRRPEPAQEEKRELAAVGKER